MAKIVNLLNKKTALEYANTLAKLKTKTLD